MLYRRSLLIASTAPLFHGCRTASRKLIAVVPKATSHLFFVSVHAGVNQAARDFSVETLWNGPNDETDSARQIEIVDAMVARGVNALAISATDSRALVAPVERAIRSGIPVTVFDSGIDIDNYVSFIATGNYDAGCTAARLLAGLIHRTGKVGMVMQKPGGTSTVLREQGFEATMAKEFPGIVIAARQYGLGDPAKARAAAENILTAQPDLAGIFASSEAASIGAIRALQSRGLAGRIRLITFDSSDLHIEALRNGTIDTMLVQEPFRLGYEAVKSLVLKLRGEQPPKRLDLPVRLIRKADLDQPEVQALLHPRA